MTLPLFCRYVAQCGTRRQECPVEMDRHELSPLRELELDDRRHDLDPGIADEDVEAPEGLDHLRNAGLDLILAGDVHGDAECALSARVDVAAPASARPGRDRR